MNVANVIEHVINLVYAGLLAWVWVYLLRLERTGCACGVDYKRAYIMGFLALRIVTLLAMNLVGWSMPALSIVLAPADIVFIVFALQYVHALKVQKCECSRDVARDVLQIVAIVDAVVAALVVLMVAEKGVAVLGWFTKGQNRGLSGALAGEAPKKPGPRARK